MRPRPPPSRHPAPTPPRSAGGEFRELWRGPAHEGSVWRIDWAHPEFGQLIASCSADKKVKIWEERLGVADGADGATAQWVSGGRAACARHGAARAERGCPPQASVCTLHDSRDQVRDVKFAPRHLGLRIAAGSYDGNVRIYEAADIMTLSSWSQLEDFKVRARVRGGAAAPCAHPRRRSRGARTASSASAGTPSARLRHPMAAVPSLPRPSRAEARTRRP